MKLTIIAATNPTNPTLGTTKEIFENFGGKAAGVCYMKDNYETLSSEAKTATDKRIAFTKQSGHHSVYDHSYISMCLEDAPKLFVMLLNNERMYSTSEKSARYTKMKSEGVEKELFDKWFAIFSDLLECEYSDVPYVVKAREKLAQENARYFLSVMTPTTMIHTVSYRQLNLLYGFAKQMTYDEHPLAKLLKPTLENFCDQLEMLGIIDMQLISNGKGRTFSLVEDCSSRIEYFGDVYCTNYLGTFMYIAHAHRHRTLKYSISLPESPNFYIPELIRGTDLEKDWLADMNSVAHLYPQGMLVNICERGIPEDFILKAKERLCARAQLETCRHTHDILKRYITSAELRVREMLEPYNKSRCHFHDFKCKEPCYFPDGITGKRRI